MTENKIEVFNPNTIMNNVRDKIKATFVDLIPDEHWEGMVNKEIDDFFKNREGYSTQREWRNMSDFQKICFESFEQETKSKIQEMLKVYTATGWENNEPKISDELKKLLEDNAASIFTRTIGNMFQQAVSSMRNY